MAGKVAELNEESLIAEGPSSLTPTFLKVFRFPTVEDDEA